MPRQDGTGPRSEGPFTGRGEGYCVLRIPDEEGRPIVGIAGRQGSPIEIPASLSRASDHPVMCCPERPLIWGDRDRRPQRGRGGRRRR